MVLSTTPAGTISHTARGLFSFFISSTNEALPVADFGGIEECLPVEPWRVGEELGFGARIVVRLGVAPHFDGPLDACERSFEG